MNTAVTRGKRKIMSARGRNRCGVAAVEFAVVAPIFFLLVFGMIEYGRLVMVQQVLTNASREGARAAVVDGSTTAQVTSVVNNYLTSAGLKTATVTVSPSPPSSAVYGATVTVSASMPFSDVGWLPKPIYLGSATLKSTVVMRRETQP